MSAHHLLTALTLVLLPLSASAEMFRCKDESGRTLFQESPCQQGQQQKAVETSVTVAIDGAMAVTKQNLMGKWCFYQNVFTTRMEPEEVTLELKSNGQYDWSDVHWQQQGSWSLQRADLTLEGFGAHRVSRLTSNSLELDRVSKMKLRRGGC